jgi:TATA-box binding protein (TBP) (component of TFIID and TFIIIB)
MSNSDEIGEGEIRIENVVASSTLGVDIDLEKVAVSLKNIETCVSP